VLISMSPWTGRNRDGSGGCAACRRPGSMRWKRLMVQQSEIACRMSRSVNKRRSSGSLPSIGWLWPLTTMWTFVVRHARPTGWRAYGLATPNDACLMTNRIFV